MRFNLKQRLIRAFLDVYELTPADQAKLELISIDKDSHYIQGETTGTVIYLQQYDPDLNIAYSERYHLAIYHHTK